MRLEMDRNDKETVQRIAKQAVYSLTKTQQITGYNSFKAEIEAVVYQAYTEGKITQENKDSRIHLSSGRARV
jgi:hypothetical protein